MKGIPELFKSALNALNEKEDNSEITEKYIEEAEDNINLYKKELTSFQNVVLSKIMLSLISFCNKKNPSENLKNMQECYEDKYESNIGKDIFKDIKKEDNKNLEKIILIILKYFLNKLRETQNYKGLKKEWEGFELNLEDFEINNNIKKELISYLENEIKVNKCEVLENILTHLKSENCFKIIKYIYYFICSKARSEIKYMKPLADKERANEEHSTKINVSDNKEIINNENKSVKNSDITKIINMEENVPKYYLIDVFKKWVIKIDLSEENITPIILFGENEITDDYSEDYYIKIKNSTEKEKYDKKFKGYIEFKNKVMKYIEDQKNNIRLKTIIKLEIKPVTENDGRRYEPEEFYKFKNIECISSYKYKKIEYKYKDQNILKYGINGKSPGFIFLINELCNDDYNEE